MKKTITAMVFSILFLTACNNQESSRQNKDFDYDISYNYEEPQNTDNLEKFIDNNNTFSIYIPKKLKPERNTDHTISFSYTEDNELIPKYTIGFQIMEAPDPQGDLFSELKNVAKEAEIYIKKQDGVSDFQNINEKKITVSDGIMGIERYNNYKLSGNQLFTKTMIFYENNKLISYNIVAANDDDLKEGTNILKSFQLIN